MEWIGVLLLTWPPVASSSSAHAYAGANLFQTPQFDQTVHGVHCMSMQLHVELAESLSSYPKLCQQIVLIYKYAS